MKEYKVIAAESAHMLSNKVSEALQEGWECTGGVHSMISNGRALVMQAVVRG